MCWNNTIHYINTSYLTIIWAQALAVTKSSFIWRGIDTTDERCIMNGGTYRHYTEDRFTIREAVGIFYLLLPNDIATTTLEPRSVPLPASVTVILRAPRHRLNQATLCAIQLTKAVWSKEIHWANPARSESKHRGLQTPNPVDCREDYNQ